jgi:hypothetical protein
MVPLLLPGYGSTRTTSMLVGVPRSCRFGGCNRGQRVESSGRCRSKDRRPRRADSPPFFTSWLFGWFSMRILELLPAYRVDRAGCRAALQLHSIERALRFATVFPGASVLSKTTPALSKSLKLKCRITSQAGRRGFDPRLPLHVFNNLGISHVLRFSSISSLSSRSPRGAR